ncbi:MAG TPA: hypothetical protein VFF88_03880 [Methylocella sp.]|nr:hypothetical protein [Methylocella sp.]
MPVNPGYYGYHIAGRMKIKFANIKPGANGLNTQGVPGTNVPPPPVVFNEYFICGAGSQDKPNTSFGCYAQILGIAGIGQAKSAPAK